MRDEIRLELVGGRRDQHRPTVRDYATSWLRSKLPALKASTRSLYATVLDVHVVPMLGDYYLDAVAREDVVRWRDAQSGAPASVNGRLRVLRTMFGDAAAELHIPNPTARVSTLRDVRGEDDHKVLAAGELRLLLEELRRAGEPHWYALALTMATTGMRFGEASALRWDDIDESAGVVRVRRAQWHGHVDTTKTGSSRSVPLAPELAEALKVHRRHLVRDQAPGLAEGWVFPAKGGGLMQPSSMRRPLARAARAAGIARGVSPHWFRHTLNDLLRRATTGEVQRAITGHVTAQMSEHYSHVGIEERRTAVTAALRLVAEAGDPAGVPAGRKKKAP